MPSREPPEVRDSDVAPVAVLIDELRNTDLQIRLNSFRQLALIAEALGQERTRDELIPYLHEFIDDDDEILMAICEEVIGLVPHVGGVEYAHVLLPPLEQFSAVEEQTVRTRAQEAIMSIAEQLSDDNVTKHVLPLVQRLAEVDWYTSRMSACHLFRSIYERVPAEDQILLREIFRDLCVDKTPMVRREACSCMGKFLEVVAFEDACEHLTQPLIKLTQDDQDSVRLLCPQMCIDLLAASKGDKVKFSKFNGPTKDMLEEKSRESNKNASGKAIEMMFPVVYALCQDKSWRVRWMVSDKFCELYSGLEVDKNESWKKELVQIFISLLGDPETEVRTAAAFKLDRVAKMFGAEKASKLLDSVKSLAKDPCQYTRAAVGSVIMGMTKEVPNSDVLEHLLPVALQLLKDQDAEVRLNIISKLDSVSEVIGMDLLTQSLLPAIYELSADKSWRVRLAIMEHIPQLAKRLSPEFFEDKLCELCTKWLEDQVFTVRFAACTTLSRLVEVYGQAWGAKHIVPKVVAVGANASCSARLTAVQAMKEIAPVGGTDILDQILPSVLKLAEDPVPNVRFNVAKTISAMIATASPEIRSQKLAPAIEKLLKDTDTDVRFYSADALEMLQTKSA